MIMLLWFERERVGERSRVVESRTIQIWVDWEKGLHA